MSRKQARLVCAALGVACAAGCESQAEQRARADAERMRRAVTELREAQNPEKRPLLEALTKTPCTAPDVCAFQQLCVSAYQAHVSGFERIERVRRTLDIDAATLEGPSALVTELQRAETALRQARKAVEACSAREGELARAHHL